MQFLFIAPKTLIYKGQQNCSLCSFYLQSPNKSSWNPRVYLLLLILLLLLCALIQSPCCQTLEFWLTFQPSFYVVFEGSKIQTLKPLCTCEWKKRISIKPPLLCSVQFSCQLLHKICVRRFEVFCNDICHFVKQANGEIFSSHLCLIIPCTPNPKPHIFLWYPSSHWISSHVCELIWMMWMKQRKEWRCTRKKTT